MKVIGYKDHDDYLAHHGIMGQKWGVRRYQNEDGTLTAAGKLRYATDTVKFAGKEVGRAFKKGFKFLSPKLREAVKAEKAKLKEDRENTAEQRRQEYKDYLKAHKQEMLNNAKDNDKWDVDFLEFVQNDVRESDTKWLLKEYDKYLDEPDEWLRGYKQKSV